MMKTVKNAIGREVPSFVEGIGELKAFQGAYNCEPEGVKHATKLPRALKAETKYFQT